MAVGAEGDRAHPPGVPRESLELPAGRDVPELHVAGDVRLTAARGESAAVGAERDGPGQGSMAAEGMDLSAGRRLPDLDLALAFDVMPIAAGRGEPPAVGAVGDAPDGA